MLKRSAPENPANLLPWQVNHTLSAADSERVTAWLETRPEAGRQLAALKELRSAAHAQVWLPPSPVVRRQILAQIPARRHSTRLAGVAGLVATLVLLIVLWAIVQPGITLRWSVTGIGAHTYRIYRAPANTSEFSLIGEISARNDVQTYSYTDLSLLPQQTYTYQIEAVTNDGNITFSPLATGYGQAVFPVQLTLILISVLVGLAAMLIIDETVRPPLRSRLKGI